MSSQSNLTQRRPPTNSQPDTKTLQPLPGPSDTRPAVAPGVINTLLLFTAAMVILPIGSYFLLLNPVFNGNSTYAGGFAALMANVVLVGYVVVAFLEDRGEDKKVGPGVVGVAVGAKKDS